MTVITFVPPTRAQSPRELVLLSKNLMWPSYNYKSPSITTYALKYIYNLSLNYISTLTSNCMHHQSQSINLGHTYISLGLWTTDMYTQIATYSAGSRYQLHNPIQFHNPKPNKNIHLGSIQRKLLFPTDSNFRNNQLQISAVYTRGHPKPLGVGKRNQR